MSEKIYVMGLETVRKKVNHFLGVTLSLYKLIVSIYLAITLSYLETTIYPRPEDFPSTQ